MGQPFEGLSQQDKTDVTVYGAAPGGGCQWDLEGLAKQPILMVGGLEESDVGRQAGRVRQQHAHGDLMAARVAHGKSGQEINQRLFQFQLAAIVQNHAGSGCGHYLGDGSQIIDRAGGDGG